MVLILLLQNLLLVLLLLWGEHRLVRQLWAGVLLMERHWKPRLLKRGERIIGDAIKWYKRWRIVDGLELRLWCCRCRLIQVQLTVDQLQALLNLLCLAKQFKLMMLQQDSLLLFNKVLCGDLVSVLLCGPVRRQAPAHGDLRDEWNLAHAGILECELPLKHGCLLRRI